MAVGDAGGASGTAAGSAEAMPVSCAGSVAAVSRELDSLLLVVADEEVELLAVVEVSDVSWMKSLHQSNRRASGEPHRQELPESVEYSSLKGPFERPAPGVGPTRDKGHLCPPH